MSEKKQGQEPKPTKKFGSIQNQWETIGGGAKGEPSMPMQSATVESKRQDVITSKQSTAEEMKRQTVYLPQSLAIRLKVHAAAIQDDISGIITRLVEQYLDEVDRGQK